MKRNDFLEMKNLDEKALMLKVMQHKTSIAELILDKNMNKLKDLKTIFKKRKDLAQILTVLKQKQLLNQSTAVSLQSSEVTEEKPKAKTKRKEQSDS